MTLNATVDEWWIWNLLGNGQRKYWKDFSLFSCFLICCRATIIYMLLIFFSFHKLDLSSSHFHNTVEPLLSGPPSSGHPLLNDHISKSQNFCNTNIINYPPLLSGCGHPESMRSPKWCFISSFTSIKRPACRIYLTQHLVIRAVNKSRANSVYL